MITVSPGQVKSGKGNADGPDRAGDIGKPVRLQVQTAFSLVPAGYRLKIGIRQLAAVVNIFLRDGKTGLFTHSGQQ